MVSRTILFALVSSIAFWGYTHATVQGFDISHYQPNVDYAGAYASGARFVIIKVVPTLFFTLLPIGSTDLHNRLLRERLIPIQSSRPTTLGPRTPS